MNKYITLCNLINICRKHGKTLLKKKINKKQINILKIFLKLKIINFIKQIQDNTYLIFINNKCKLQIKMLSNNKKMTIDKKTKKTNKKLFIITNNYGFSAVNVDTHHNGGVAFAKIHL